SPGGTNRAHRRRFRHPRGARGCRRAPRDWRATRTRDAPASAPRPHYRADLARRPIGPSLSSLEPEHARDALRDRIGVAVRTVGVTLRAAIPGLPEREPVDRCRRLSGAQLFIERAEVERPAEAIVVARESGPVPVAVVVQVRVLARLAVSPGRE